jgi:hypothetical protein
VRTARLRLRFIASPALLQDLSHLEGIAERPDGRDHPLPECRRRRRCDVELDRAVSGYNELRLQLIGHYTLECEIVRLDLLEIAPSAISSNTARGAGGRPGRCRPRSSIIATTSRSVPFIFARRRNRDCCARQACLLVVQFAGRLPRRALSARRRGAAGAMWSRLS